MIYYGLNNNTGKRYILVAIPIFSKFGFGAALKNKTAQTKTNEFSIIIHNFICEPSLIETDN